MMHSSNLPNGTAGDHLAHVMSLPRAGLVSLAKSYDWSQFPEAVLGWIMAQKGVDLDTALGAFFKGAPERFNYVPKRDVPEEFHGACQLLDNICLRINSGFYLINCNATPSAHLQLRHWLDVQQADRCDGNAGRWVIDEDIVEALLRRCENIAQEPDKFANGDAPVTGLRVRLRNLLRAP